MVSHGCKHQQIMLNDVECPSASTSLAAEYRRGMSWSFERLPRKWASLGLELVRNAQKQSFHELSNLHPPAHKPTFHFMALRGSFGWSSEAGFGRGSLLMTSCWFGIMSNASIVEQAKHFLQLSVCKWNLEHPGTSSFTSSFTPKTPVQIAGRSYA